MKKTIAILLFISLFMSLCACKASQTINKTEEMLELEMQLNLLHSLEEITEANNLVIEGLLLLKQANFKDSQNKHEEALTKLEQVERRVECVIDSPNIIYEEVNNLQEQFKEMIQIIEKGFEISEDEWERLIFLEKQAAIVQSELIQIVQCFSTLYRVRRFDNWPDEEADSKLKEIWWEFQFGEDVECPETIEEQELYLIWARQFSENFYETEEFLKKLERLREAESLTSKSTNKEWCNFVETYILGTWTEAEFTASVILYNRKVLYIHILDNIL